MPEKKTKIVLDADVIIHFSKGGKLDLLPKILKEFKFIVLDIVKRELPDLLLPILQKQITIEKNIFDEVFGETSVEKREYAKLIASNGMALGKGESACMVYCRFHNDVVGSSNTKDIAEYCDQNGITYLTTNDFLFYAIQRKILTKAEAESFIRDVRNKGSYPPIVDFDSYICTKI